MTIRNWRWQPDGIAITWENGHASEYPAIWLLDNDPAHRDSATGQRVIDIADLPLEPLIEHAALQDNYLRLSWLGFASSTFPVDWLRRNCPCPAHTELRPLRLWTASDQDVLRRFAFQDVRDSCAVRFEWLETVLSAGIAFLEGVPAEPGQVLEVASLIGWVRETNYGRIFDVRAVPDPNNLAYTNRPLALHTDNPYRDPVPGLQILHCLCAGREGGVSLFADGFAIAEALRAEGPGSFQLLASTPVSFSFRDPETELTAVRPILQVDAEGRVKAVHYNSRSIAPLRMEPAKIPEFYVAWRAFSRLLADPRFLLTTSLAPEELVLFDNHRILHGRTGFASADPRHLQGCYLDQDGLRSRITILKQNAYR
jgi:gamma-butyrobetaine dioxygenase